VPIQNERIDQGKQYVLIWREKLTNRVAGFSTPFKLEPKVRTR
jgi:hypothetical protein